ncbi:hypothetical protein KPH14_000947 [Odynerus spinipes]|uniref:Peptidase aspartic putative domain-containing protein n=1 Tax=Odynerus spinipes TaxID=1348599 RepID=A0AAD9RIP9_9HYME|nr:hypothetical protein KPH14_000947 [Odynerus spinipes]
MTNIEQLIKRQGDTVTSVFRFLESFNRITKAKVTEDVIRTHLNVLHNLWEKCTTLHTNIIDAVSIEQQETLPYFTDKVYTNTEDAYFSALDHLNELLDSRRETASSPSNDSTNASSRPSPMVQLPRIDLPKFSATTHVVLLNENGNSIQVRALIDQSSESTLVTERIAQFLCAPRHRVYAPISVVNEQVSSVSRSVVDLKARLRHGSIPTVTFQALVLPKLSYYQPPRQVSIKNWSHLKNLDLVDLEPTSIQPLDVLFGVDMLDEIMGTMSLILETLCGTDVVKLN